MCNTGSIPAPLMTFMTTMAARGIQLKVLNEALLMGMIFGFLPRGEEGAYLVKWGTRGREGVKNLKNGWFSFMDSPLNDK